MSRRRAGGAWVAAVAAVLVFACGGQGRAAEATVGADLYSAYVWRGITLNDGAVVQPWLDVTVWKGLSVAAWGNVDLDDYDGAKESGEMSEVDLVLYYTHAFEGVEVEVGWTEYLYPFVAGEPVVEEGLEPVEATIEAVEGTREVYGKVRGDLFAGVSAEGAAYYDIDEAEDFYASLKLAYGLELTEEVSAELSGTVGYAGEDWAAYNSGAEEGEAGFSEYTVLLDCTYAPAEGLELTGHLAYTDSLDEDVLPEQDVDFFGGASVRWSF